jgi:hypothetical protein
MKLSEAIRKGSEGRGQLRNGFYRQTTGEVCATTAAFVGATGRLPVSHSAVAIEVEEQFPELAEWAVDDDGYEVCTFTTLAHDIFIMNDEEELTFEEIATKLEGMGL